MRLPGPRRRRGAGLGGASVRRRPAADVRVPEADRLQHIDSFRDEHSALAKAFVTTRMREVVAWSRETFGGDGILLDHDIARFFADAEAISSFEGTREMNTLIVGKSITGRSAFV